MQFQQKTKNVQQLIINGKQQKLTIFNHFTHPSSLLLQIQPTFSLNSTKINQLNSLGNLPISSKNQLLLSPTIILLPIFNYPTLPASLNHPKISPYPENRGF